MKGNQTGTTTWSQNEHRSNDNEGVIHTPQIFTTGASPSGAV